MVGSASTAAAAVSVASYWRLAPEMIARPSGAVRGESLWIMTSASRNSFQVHMIDRIQREREGTHGAAGSVASLA